MMLGSINGGFDERRPRKADAVDAHVGDRLRLRRQILGWSQDKLASKTNLSFQMIQRYESGEARIAASRLFQFSRLLEVPVDYFFESILGFIPSPSQSQEFSPDFLQVNFLSAPDGMDFNRALAKIVDPAKRQIISRLVKALSGAQA